MEFLKKFGFWIAFVVVAVGAVIFYMMAVRSQSVERKRQLKDLQSRRDTLKSLANKGDQTPNAGWVEREEEFKKVVDAEISKCRQIVFYQRRRNHTKLFWVRGDPTKEEVRMPTHWLDRYREEKERLQGQIVESGVGAENMVAFPDYWGVNLPTWGQIRNAQVHFWLRKDVIDLLTNQAEKDILAELKFWADKKMQTLLDVVRNPSAIEQELSTLLNQSKSKKELEGILKDILVNAEQLDLDKLFQRHKILETVERVTMDDRQRKFLRHLRSSAKDRPDLDDYVMDLRMVRYRDDLIGLFKNHGFTELGRRLRNWGADSEALLTEELAGPSWRALRLARAIEAAVSIADDRDLNVILRNHRVRLLSVGSLGFDAVTIFDVKGGKKGGSAMPGAEGRDRGPSGTAGGLPGAEGRDRGPSGTAGGLPGVYNAFPFKMTLTLEFRHLPVLYRRLLMSDWRIEIKGLRVTKASGARGRQRQRTGHGRRPPGMEMPAEMEGQPPAPAGGRLGGRGAQAGPMQPGVPAARPGIPEEGGEAPGVEPGTQEEKRTRITPRNYVSVNLECEARQFYPLWAALNPEKAKAIEQRFASE